MFSPGRCRTWNEQKMHIRHVEACPPGRTTLRRACAGAPAPPPRRRALHERSRATTRTSSEPLLLAMTGGSASDSAAMGSEGGHKPPAGASMHGGRDARSWSAEMARCSSVGFHADRASSDVRDLHGEVAPRRTASILVSRRPRRLRIMPVKETRRGFLETLGWALAALGLGGRAGATGTARPGRACRRALGRTGVEVSCIGIGGYHLGIPRDEQETTRLIRSAVDRGITFMDNCWDYHAGESERRMGNALRDGYRQRVFLMSKIDGHTRAAAAGQIDESLRRLRTDRIDLMQFHEVIRPDDPERIFAPGGAWEAMDAARKAGKVRFVGFTGHKSQSISTCSRSSGRTRARSTPSRCRSTRWTGTSGASSGEWFPS